jgi:oligoendopeptidase F
MRRFFARPFSRIVIGLLTVTQPIYTKEVMQRSEIPSKNKWNVEALYADPSAWLQEFTSIKGIEELGKYKGQLGDPKTLSGFMEKYITLDRKLNKLATYAHLRADEDLGNDTYKANYGRVLALAQDFQVHTSWLEPELLTLHDSIFQDPSLAQYRFFFEQILRARPHTLTADKEELLALSSKALQSSQKAFSALSNADMTFQSAVDSKGQEHVLTNGSYGKLIQSPDRELRRTSMLHLHEGFKGHINSICEMLQGNVLAHLFHAKARNYPDCVTAALFGKNINPSVLKQVIATVKKHRPVMEDYIALRKKLLGVDAVHAYDLNCPLVPEMDFKITYDEACKVVIDSVASLGIAYQSALRKGLLEDRWVDPFECKGKRSGAYSSGCYDSMPYILMNFHDTVHDTMTLAHEAGHSMHSYLSRQNQPPIYAQYSIFVAEVASTFNEQLLIDELMKKAKTNREKAYLINDQIDRIRSTIVRQTLFADFELKIHELAEANQTLTPTVLNQLYGQLMKEYYGADLVVDPEVEAEWSRIPHFYYNFYVYQYATGLSAALALHEQAMKSKEARDKYLKFLSSGGSKYPLDLLKEAGVDMASPEPVDIAMQKFSRLVTQLKRLLNASP